MSEGIQPADFTASAPLSPPSQGSNQAALKTRLSQHNIACRLDKEDLRQLLDVLQERARAAESLEWTHIGVHIAEEHRGTAQNELHRGFELKPTVIGRDGQELFGTISEVFDSPSFPAEVKLVAVYSNLVLRAAYNVWPRNSFELLLDFERPNVFDFRLAPNHPTPNPSYFQVDGYDAPWANGVFHEVETLLKRNPGPRWIHRHSVYDALVWIFGFPFGFYVCFRLEAAVATAPSPFIRAALYTYVFVLTLLGLRILFHYARWAFPIAEFKHKSSRALAHRIVLGVLSLSLASSLIYDALKFAL